MIATRDVVTRVFYVLLAFSCCCLYVALRARSWPFALASFILATPTALVASLPYFALIWWVCLLLALAVGLRWSADPMTWLALALIATGVWFVAVASCFLLHWPRELWWVLPGYVLLGFAALAMPRSPWSRVKA
jgi:hypothetical protein